MELSPEEVRVLGCLVEKAATTPDNYPLSTNALLAACNQSTSRDPVVSYDERTVDSTMLGLREQKLARTVRGTGHRTHKHRHVLDEAWGCSAGELAVLAVLMLRGPQTPGELRTRTERYADSGGEVGVEAALRNLAARGQPIVARLERQPGHKEARWAHLLSGPVAGASATQAPDAWDAPAPPAGPPAVLPAAGRIADPPRPGAITSSGYSRPPARTAETSAGQAPAGSGDVVDGVDHGGFDDRAAAPGVGPDALDPAGAVQGTGGGQGAGVPGELDRLRAEVGELRRLVEHLYATLGEQVP